MTWGRSWAGTGTIAIVAVVMLASASSARAWEREYYASSQTMPESTATGWAFYNGFQRAFSGATLYENTSSSGDPFHAMGWENTTGTFNFNTGFVMEARLKMVAATSLYDRWGGAEIYARSTAGYNMSIDVDPDEVILGSIFNYVSYPMVTTDAFHTYRAEASANVGKLYVDDVLRLQMPLAADNPIKSLWFGDQGWEGGEMYFDYVRYGATAPEPASAAMTVVGGAVLMLRRRKQRG
jgi:hypothetical protein